MRLLRLLLSLHHQSNQNLYKNLQMTPGLKVCVCVCMYVCVCVCVCVYVCLCMYVCGVLICLVQLIQMNLLLFTHIVTPTNLQLLHHVASHTGYQWRLFCDCLGLERSCIHEADYRGKSLTEKCYEALLLWLQGEGKEPKWWTTILQALRKSDLTSVALDIQHHITSGTLDEPDMRLSSTSFELDSPDTPKPPMICGM